MDEELKKRIDAAMEPLERIRSERKRIMDAVLAEGSNDLLDDPFANSGLEGVYRELQRREIYRQAQSYWMGRKLVDLLCRPESEEDSLLKSERDGPETTAGSVAGQFQQPDHDEQL